MNYLVYDSSGKILRCGICPQEDFQHQAHNPGENVMEGVANDATQYLLDGVLTNKAVMPVTLDKTIVNIGEAVTFGNIPVGTSVNIDGDSATVVDGSLVVDFDTSGGYEVRMSFFPYLEYKVTIICN